MRRIAIWAVVLVCATLLFSGVQAQLGAMPVEKEKKIRGNVEVAFGQLSCSDFETLIDFEGTAGFATDRFELSHPGDFAPAECADLLNAVALRAQQIGCVTSQVSISPFFSSLNLVCHGERNTVVGAVGDIASEFLSFPASGPA